MQIDPITQNLAQTWLHTKCFIEGSAETVPTHIAELQRLQEACRGLGVDVTDTQFAGVITLSMPSPSWDPVIGTLGGILDLKVVILCLNTKWSRRQGPTSGGKDSNMVFQTSSRPKCENCNRPGHIKAKCWSKGGGQEGQFPWKNNGRTSNTVNSVTDTPIVWAYGSSDRSDTWFADSAATIHVSPSRGDFSSYRKYEQERDIKAFRNNSVKGVGEGDIEADIEYGGKTMRIRLTQVMHVPEAEGKILSLKVLAQKGFQSHILADCICITKDNITYAEALLETELYEVKARIILSQESILATVKRDSVASNLYTWNWRLGHLGDSMLKQLARSTSVKGMDIMNSHLTGICGNCVLGKMDERPFESRMERDSHVFGTLHADLIGPMTPEARWSHAKFSLIIHDDSSSFGFTFNLTQKDQTAKVIIGLDKVIENKFQKRVHTLKTDNGGEFVNSELQAYCQERGITSSTLVAYNPELNGHAERQNRTHIEGV